MSKSTDITAHVKGNVPMNVGIGGYADARGTDQHNQGLSERRVNAIRDALVKAERPSASRSLSATNRLTLAGSAIVASTWDFAPASN